MRFAELTITALILFFSVFVRADDIPAKSTSSCFELSSDGKLWSRTPEVLCISPAPKTGTSYTLSLRTGIPGSQIEIATYHFDLLKRVHALALEMPFAGNGIHRRCRETGLNL